jgi:hypothetical protein
MYYIINKEPVFFGLIYANIGNSDKKTRLFEKMDLIEEIM